MSTTPRTDAHVARLRLDPEASGCDQTLSFARQLETELAAMKALAEKAEAELARFRALFPAICSALGNGACCTPDVSIGFLESIPNEVASVVSRLRAEVELDEDLQLATESSLKTAIARAEKAEAECLEQARLLGKSGEREADLLGKLERLARDRARLDWLERRNNIAIGHFTWAEHMPLAGQQIIHLLEMDDDCEISLEKIATAPNLRDAIDAARNVEELNKRADELKNEIQTKNWGQDKIMDQHVNEGGTPT